MKSGGNWVYLAAPYSDPDPEVIKQRMEIYNRVDAKLIKRGYFTMSPLSKHSILEYENIPGDWKFWKDYSTSMLGKCDIFCIICMKGWRESVGVQAELQLALEKGLVIIYLDENGERIEIT